MYAYPSRELAFVRHTFGTEVLMESWYEISPKAIVMGQSHQCRRAAMSTVVR